MVAHEVDDGPVEDGQVDDGPVEDGQVEDGQVDDGPVEDGQVAGALSVDLLVHVLPAGQINHRHALFGSSCGWWKRDNQTG